MYLSSLRSKIRLSCRLFVSFLDCLANTVNTGFLYFPRSDKPGKPEGPLNVMDIYRDRCRLSWKPPLDDGGMPILRYIVEAQDMETKKWVKVGKVEGDTQCGVPGLEPGKRYKFRVKAVNSEGESEPLVNTDEILAKDPYGTARNTAITGFNNAVTFT